jgi:uncharacterized membrane-anchored protein
LRIRAPAGVEPIVKDGWGAVVTYGKDGYVKDSDAPEGTLNYDIRVLGRYGVLSLNAVAGAGALLVELFKRGASA